MLILLPLLLSAILYGEEYRMALWDTGTPAGLQLYCPSINRCPRQRELFLY